MTKVRKLKFGLPRDLQKVLGYVRWENFYLVVNRAQLNRVNNRVTRSMSIFVRLLKWFSSAVGQNERLQILCLLAMPVI